MTHVNEEITIESATEFSENYLDGETKVTPEEFIDAKLAEQSQISGAFGSFDYAFTNPFYNGLEDLDMGDGCYEVIDMLILWKSIEDELNED